MSILAVNHVQITIPKGQEDAARAFYCDVLGLQEVAKPTSLQGRGGFWLQFENGFQVHVGTEDGFNRLTTKAHVAYEVSDLAGWRGKLEATGCDILESVPIPGYIRFEFRDPFGNRVEFLQRLATE